MAGPAHMYIHIHWNLTPPSPFFFSFFLVRVGPQAEALVEHMRSLPLSGGGMRPTARDALRKIHYFRVHSYVEQLAVLQTLEALLESIGTVRLIVIDSVAFHFRRDFDDMVRTSPFLGIRSFFWSGCFPSSSTSL